MFQYELLFFYSLCCYTLTYVAHVKSIHNSQRRYKSIQGKFIKGKNKTEKENKFLVAVFLNIT